MKNNVSSLCLTTFNIYRKTIFRQYRILLFVCLPYYNIKSDTTDKGYEPVRDSVPHQLRQVISYLPLDKYR